MTEIARSKESDIAGRILVVDDHARARESISDVLRHAGHHVACYASAVEALKRLDTESYDVVITDLQMPGMTGMDFIRHIERRRLGVQVLMVTAHATVASAVEAMRYGAFDYIEKPFDVDRLEQLVSRALQRGALLDRRRKLDGSAVGEVPSMAGASQAMQNLRARIVQVARTSETVLITGESGTGKELVARSIHIQSDRSAAPLVSLNCPALSAQLMESELFGHEKGAFTGADTARTGRFELADGGTILLDEVTEIDLSLQAKLLRVLQERTFEHVGSSETIKTDVRVLATTNRELRHEVADGNFREDLYYRLAVLPIAVPPLRERGDDTAELTRVFLERTDRRLGKDPRTLEPGAYDLLASYHWPGNVRELENIITRACVLGDGKPISADELRPWLIESPGAAPGAVTASVSIERVPVGLSLEEMERKLIEATLEHFDGHRAKAAGALGIGIRTLSGKLKSYGYAPRTKCFAKAG